MDQRRELIAFYRTLESDDERAVVWPALAAAPAALPLAWEALAGSEALREAAIRAMVRMGGLANRNMSTAESELRKKPARAAETVISSDSNLADWLLARLSGVDPADPRLPGAVRVLGQLALSADWRLSAQAGASLAALLIHRPDPAGRESVLRFIARLEPSQLNRQPDLQRAIEGLSARPDPHLFPALQSAVRRHDLPISVPEPRAATAAGVLNRLARADPELGRFLFFDASGGAGCAVCHRIDGTGGDFAPDLTGVGTRLTPEALIDAILNPSATITEGYDLHRVETGTESHLGAIVREDDREIVMMGADGRRFTVRAGEVTQRHKLGQSVMPANYVLFGDQAVGDLTAFLQGRRR